MLSYVDLSCKIFDQIFAIALLKSGIGCAVVCKRVLLKFDQILALAY